MAVYPTPAGHRMAYDRDGSVLFACSGEFSGTVTQLDATTTRAINSEGGEFSGFGRAYGVLFPELRDVQGYFVQTDTGDHNGTLQWSPDTTTGLDGTWTTITTSFFDNWNNPVAPAYRADITAVALSSVKGFRWDKPGLGHNFVCIAAHFYGQPSAGQNPDSLRCWQPITDAEVTTVFDYGDVPRGTTSTKTFRIKNLSATKAATSITVSAEALTDASPTLISQFLFSTDNVTFAASINIGNLAPGAISAVLYVRDNVDAGAALSVWALRGVATPVSFA